MTITKEDTQIIQIGRTIQSPGPIITHPTKVKAIAETQKKLTMINVICQLVPHADHDSARVMKSDNQPFIVWGNVERSDAVHRRAVKIDTRQHFFRKNILNVDRSRISCRGVGHVRTIGGESYWQQGICW